MGISQFPAAAAAGGGGVSAFAAELADLNTTYQHDNVFEAGVYTVSVNPTTTNCVATFVDGSSVLSTVSTTSGTVALTLATAATKVFLTLRNGGTPGSIVTIQKTASSLNPDDIGNGTLDTITATGTYNQTGLLSVLCIGGGQAGEGAYNVDSGFGGGGGGRAGYINAGVVYTNTATTVTIGAKGTANNSHGGNRVDPTGSSFGNLITTNTASTDWANASGSNGVGRGSNGSVGNATQTFVSWNGGSTTGSGGGGNGIRVSTNSSRAGGGSGIGTGGSSGRGGDGDYTNSNPTNPATDATGYGSGGGGGIGTGNSFRNNAVGALGSDGADGVIYVLRGW